MNASEDGSEPVKLGVTGRLAASFIDSKLTPLLVLASVLLGVASSGLHTNGYSLVRKIFRGLPLEASPAGLDTTLGEALLAPHRSPSEATPRPCSPTAPALLEPSASLWSH